MNQFLYGMNTMGFLMAGLFFLRFWQKTADSLFIAFSAAFLLFAIDQFAHAFQSYALEPSLAFIFRLAGFGLLIVAVLRKNLK